MLAIAVANMTSNNEQWTTGAPQEMGQAEDLQEAVVQEESSWENKPMPWHINTPVK